MTGAERMTYIRWRLKQFTLTDVADILAALGGCVLLTAEEAEKVRHGLRHPDSHASFHAGNVQPSSRSIALALLENLSPERKP